MRIEGHIWQVQYDAEKEYPELESIRAAAAAADEFSLRTVPIASRSTRYMFFAFVGSLDCVAAIATSLRRLTENEGDRFEVSYVLDRWPRENKIEVVLSGRAPSAAWTAVDGVADVVRGFLRLPLADRLELESMLGTMPTAVRFSTMSSFVPCEYSDSAFPAEACCTAFVGGSTQTFLRHRDCVRDSEMQPVKKRGSTPPDNAIRRGYVLLPLDAADATSRRIVLPNNARILIPHSDD